MNKYKLFFILVALLATVTFMGCQNDQNPVEPFFNSNQSNQIKLSTATIPFGSTIDSAKFYINTTAALNEEVTLHRITSDWQELVITWNNFGGSFNTDSEGSFIPSTTGLYSVDITAVVSNWFDETYPNYGVLLKEVSPAQFQTYSSRESGDSPYLMIWWTLDDTSGYDSTSAFADSYIQSDQGDDNFGSSSELFTGWQDTAERQTLVEFEIELVYTGCTHSKGYWKTHSIYGPAPYDSTWALVGEDSTFFLSNQSYYEVMWTPPRGGNAYYILAHQYIGTKLNFENGADPSEAQAAFDEATDLFNTYTPEYIGSLKGNDQIRQQFLELKDMLDQYNNGIIGPGKCEESSAEFPYRIE
ncbi:MAG: DNRLRE domain-containing protein [Ignavibacteriaceae bacterium]|jgi:hypothetical protein